MIQRVQTIFIILSMLCTTALLYIPIGVIEGTQSLTATAVSLTDSESGEVVHTNLISTIVFLAFLGIQLLVVFNFKNRIRQVMLARLSLVFLVALAVAALLIGDTYALFFSEVSVPEEMNYSWSVLLFVLPWLFTYLAIRAIKKDEALVRSADRLR